MRKVAITSEAQPSTSVLQRKLVVTSCGQINVLLLEEVIRCESEGNYTWFYLSGERKLLASKNLKEYEYVLSPHNFFRVHQSHLINIDYLECFKRRKKACVVMKDKTLIPVSDRKVKELKEYLYNLQCLPE
jgi:two-component system LytT family response regulator